MLSAVGFLLFASHGASAVDPDIPAPLVDTIQQALDEWAEFASTGDITAIETGFAPEGPQRRQLERESTAIENAGDLEPFRFTVRELRLRSLGAESATVWARVEATRSGLESQIFSWDFDLIRSDGRWQVWTVVAAKPPLLVPPPDLTVHETPVPSAVTTTAAPDESIEAATVEADMAPTDPSVGGGVRLPALSAWIIVITVVGVALAGYLAPRLERREER
ncbi:MAG TPA: hypothetical protein ENH00_09355 [Actinobacteria bacterium]|nr:hypothetical protein [Actinomycetota bacterium]